ncbi:MAG: GNAT family N-acetyltransferase [Frankiaceae bacterium]|nr:GNAT family N-acetyltransferase [Frankiaceae bacterium]
MGTLRRATPADAEDLTRLRGLMHLAMGAASLPDEWRVACEASFRRRLTEPDFVAFGVEEAGRLVSCGAGWLEEHLPSPGQFDGRRGHIASMSTEVEWKRRGYARQVFAGLMGWFAEQGVPRVDLRATDDGRGLYESFGFRVLGGATMAWTAPGVRPGMPGR